MDVYLMAFGETALVAIGVGARIDVDPAARGVPPSKG